jgi:predicted DsbA family dithiol-disulfide isomerase
MRRRELRTVKIEVWSDMACPWCYIGKRRLETALAEFEQPVEVEWRSFELNPGYPKDKQQPVFEVMIEKHGSVDQARAMARHIGEIAAQEGLTYDFEHSIMANTFDAQRVTHLAKAHGLGAEMHERLMRAQLIEGEALNDVDTLVRLAAEVGVDDSAARRVLTSDEYASEVSKDTREAQALGVTGVPFFVLDRRYGISGAQPVEAFRSALNAAADAAQRRGD